jgi:hypothetical protein
MGAAGFRGGSGTGGLRFKQYRHTKRRQKGLDGNDHETVDWTAKRKGNDETNAMVCSPSAKDERWRRKSSLELERTMESTSDSRDRPHHGVELGEGNSKVVSICTGSARFRRKSSPEVRRNLVDAKVRRGFVGARVIETGWGWRRWKEDAKEIAGNYLLAEIESDFYFLFFLISEINFGLKIITGKPEIIIKSRKILWKLRNILENY